MKEWITLLPIEFEVLLVFLLSFGITYLVIPRIITIVKIKNLMDDPNDRSSHKEKTPTFGGIAFFLSLIVSLFFINMYLFNLIGLNIAVGLTILFFTGLKDDLVEISAKVKILAQIFAFFCVIAVNLELFPVSFEGILGIYKLPPLVSLLFGCFVMLSIVNSYNLIDGINGSASMVGSVVFLIFSYVFFKSGLIYYSLLSLISFSFLVAFLRYNLSSKHRIFMGDTGSMIVGFVMGLLTLKYLSIDAEKLINLNINPINKLALIIAILFIPFVDTLRVFIIRTVKHGKPFSPDRSHVHHVMIDYMHLSHAKASMLLAFINIMVFIIVYTCNFYFSSVIVYGILFFMIISFAVALFYFNRSYNALKYKHKIRSSFRKKSD